MYHLLWHKKLRNWPTRLNLCFVWCSRKTAIICLCEINPFVFVIMNLFSARFEFGSEIFVVWNSCLRSLMSGQTVAVPNLYWFHVRDYCNRCRHRTVYFSAEILDVTVAGWWKTGLLLFVSFFFYHRLVTEAHYHETTLPAPWLLAMS